MRPRSQSTCRVNQSEAPSKLPLSNPINPCVFIIPIRSSKAPKRQQKVGHWEPEVAVWKQSISRGRPSAAVFEERTGGGVSAFGFRTRSVIVGPWGGSAQCLVHLGGRATKERGVRRWLLSRSRNEWWEKKRRKWEGVVHIRIGIKTNSSNNEKVDTKWGSIGKKNRVGWDR